MQKYKIMKICFISFFYICFSCCFNPVIHIKGCINPICFAFSFSLGQYPKSYHIMQCFNLQFISRRSPLSQLIQRELKIKV